MGKVADPLREFADRHADKLGAAIVGDTQTAESSAWHYLYRLADQIDRDHEIRMEQCRRETKRAYSRYLRSVIEDYTVRSRKRTVPTKSIGVWDGSHYHCSHCGGWLCGYPKCCPECGCKVKYMDNGRRAVLDG